MNKEGIAVCMCLLISINVIASAAYLLFLGEAILSILM